MTLAPETPRKALNLSRRELLLIGGKTMLIGGLVYRANDLQLHQSPELREVAKHNSIRTRLLAPARSEILDRSGHVIANTRPIYSIVLEVGHAPDPAKSLMRLSQIAPLSRESRRTALRMIEEQPRLRTIVLIESANLATVDRVAANAPSLPGIHAQQRWVRNYPFGESFSHTVGYVGKIADRDIARNPELGRLADHPDFRVGKRGVELRRNKRLAGTPGLLAYEVNALGLKQRELRRNDAVRGADLRLTLDSDLQNYAAERFAGQSGAAVVMDVHDGDLLCLLSTPGFDPNQFADGVSSKYWSGIRENPRKPLIDRAMTGGYPPGSTFKMVVALAALEKGARHPDTTTFCPGQQALGNRVFHCWKPGGHGTVALRNALKQSCDVYFYNAGDAVGIDAIADMARRLGFGIAHDIDTNVPIAGVVPTLAWKQAQEGRRWSRGDTFNAAIGQGFVLSTPLQLAVMAARIANGAERVSPRLVLPEPGSEQADAEPLEIHPNHLALVRDAMFAVCNEQQGTAYATRIADPALAMAGKTGTSQVRRILRDRNGRALRQEDMPREYRHHALFVAFAPADRPRYAAAVIVEHGISGGRAAAPIARDLLLHAMTGVSPDHVADGSRA